MTTQKADPPAPRRATIHTFTWGKVVAEHEIGPYQIVEYHPYKSGSAPTDHQGRRVKRETEAGTAFHVYCNGDDTNQSARTLEGAMLVAISHKTLGRHAPGLAMLCRALRLDEDV